MKLLSSFTLLLLLITALFIVAIAAHNEGRTTTTKFGANIKADRFHKKQSFKNCLYNTIQFNSSTSDELMYSATAAAGLLNRNGISAYTIRSSDDQAWQSILLDPLCSTNNISPEQAIFTAFGTGEFARIILYSSSSWNYTLPSVTTMAGVLGAVPLSDTLYKSLSQSNPQAFKGVVTVLDTRGMWRDEYEAVNFTIQHALSQTVSMSFSVPNNIQQGKLVDLIVGGKYFAQGLPNACIPFTQSNKLLQQIIQQATHWPRPIKVIGYNNEDPLFGGDLFEAETDCFGVPHVMGQVASDSTTNLMFWSKFAPFDFNAPRGSEFGNLTQPQISKNLVYNSSKKYVALVYGDLDNLGFVLSFAREHLQWRAKTCQQEPSKCFPFSWTLSPHLIEFAPAIARYYYSEMALSGGKDSVMLPPSGYLYSYPGFMPLDTQALYVEQQQRVSTVYDTTSSINWNWVFMWGRSFETYFPRYVGKSNPLLPNTKNFFLLSVPWPVPELGNFTRWVGNKTDPSTNVFTSMKHFVWQKGGGGGMNLSPVQAAKKIEQFKTGSVNHVYIIQNTPIQEIFECVANITDPDVVLVSHADLGELARLKAVQEGE